ncbi:MAG: DUF4384 domain-containing protein [Bacteroidia bacterium]
MSNLTSESTQAKNGFVGSNELLKLVIQKLSSQILLYGLGMAILLIVAVMVVGKEYLAVIGSMFFVFLVTIIGYLFFEGKKRIEQADPKTLNQLVTAQMSTIKHSEGANGMKLWTTRKIPSISTRDISTRAKDASFKVGDKIIIHFQPDRDGYLTLLNIGTSGDMTTLFPNSLQRSNMVLANREYTIPRPEDDFEYILQGPSGKEKLKAILTNENIELMEDKLDDQGNLFKTVNAGLAARNIGIIKKKVSDLPSEAWTETSCEFEVAE